MAGKWHDAVPCVVLLFKFNTETQSHKDTELFANNY